MEITTNKANLTYVLDTLQATQLTQAYLTVQTGSPTAILHAHSDAEEALVAYLPVQNTTPGKAAFEVGQLLFALPFMPSTEDGQIRLHLPDTEGHDLPDAEGLKKLGEVYIEEFSHTLCRMAPVLQGTAPDPHNSVRLDLEDGVWNLWAASQVQYAYSSGKAIASKGSIYLHKNSVEILNMALLGMSDGRLSIFGKEGRVGFHWVRPECTWVLYAAQTASFTRPKFDWEKSDHMAASFTTESLKSALLNFSEDPHCLVVTDPLESVLKYRTKKAKIEGGAFGEDFQFAINPRFLLNLPMMSAPSLEFRYTKPNEPVGISEPKDPNYMHYIMLISLSTSSANGYDHDDDWEE